jgi:hypothetical protein
MAFLVEGLGEQRIEGRGNEEREMPDAGKLAQRLGNWGASSLSRLRKRG